MSLTPAITDKNRKDELKRVKVDPHSFGQDVSPLDLPKGWTDVGLKNDKKEESEKKESEKKESEKKESKNG